MRASAWTQVRAFPTSQREWASLPPHGGQAPAPGQGGGPLVGVLHLEGGPGVGPLHAVGAEGEVLRTGAGGLVGVGQDGDPPFLMNLLHRRPPGGQAVSPQSVQVQGGLEKEPGNMSV